MKRLDKKYPMSLIWDYVNGNEIIGYDIDDLEDDYLFMIEVFNITKDKKMYEMCGDNVKNNHYFVKYLLSTFKEDKQFIKMVADLYIKDLKHDSIEYKEIVVLMSELLKKDEMGSVEYKVMAFGMYEEQLMVNYATVKDALDKHPRDDLGLGFLVILEEYASSPILMDFFAKRFIAEIFKEVNGFSLEHLLHLNFNSFEKLKEYGINSFLINYIRNNSRCRDIYLADYVDCNCQLLHELNKLVHLFGSNWDNFERRNNKLKVDLVMDNVCQLMEQKQFDCRFMPIDAIYYVAKKMGLEKKIKDYEQHEFEEFEQFDYLGSEIFKYGIDDMILGDLNFQEKVCLKYTEKIMKVIFQSKVVQEGQGYLDDFVTVSEDERKIININQRRKVRC